MQKLYHNNVFLIYLAIYLAISHCIPFIVSKTTDPPTPTPTPTPAPTPWPHQFHSLLFMNNTSAGALQKVDLWYDWPNRRNFNIIQNQLNKLYYDLEWDNGTSYIYTLDSDKECRVLNFPVGILRPDWLEGSIYLGQKYMDGFLCNVWKKVDFIWYYEDVATRRPVYWAYYTGYVAHVMTFEVGAVLDDTQWQAPAYCFREAKEEQRPLSRKLIVPTTTGRLLRGANKLVTTI